MNTQHTKGGQGRSADDVVESAATFTAILFLVGVAILTLAVVVGRCVVFHQ